MFAPTVSFSGLSKNPGRVADTVERAHRVHVTRRDGEDLYLTTEQHDREREESAELVARLFTALIGSDAGSRAVQAALPEVFPWTRRLAAQVVREFVVDLVNAAHDAAELDVHSALHRVVVEWRLERAVLDHCLERAQV
ncbi:prevent-host-death family protein [Streptomyces sp. NPDC049954]|uniref:prevent-host-death family protein n=1 Tax=Streptomyces sp. NPDC049954 TaxID=3155779 RepID=UPI0034131E83